MFSELVSAMISMAGLEGGSSPKKRLLGGPGVTHVPSTAFPRRGPQPLERDVLGLDSTEIQSTSDDQRGDSHVFWERFNNIQ